MELSLMANSLESLLSISMKTFQCPVCAQFTQLNGPYIESLIAEKKATVVYHTLSFLGPESVNAANAAACSADEGKFLDSTVCS
jgi:protein-disulfide isomerase